MRAQEEQASDGEQAAFGTRQGRATYTRNGSLGHGLGSTALKAASAAPVGAPGKLLLRQLSQQLKKKGLGPIAAVLATIIIMFVLVGVNMAPGLFLIKSAEDFVKDLNVQHAAVNRTNHQLWKLKLSKSTTSSDIKVLEKFRTVNMNAMRTSFKKAGIDVSFAKTSSGQAESRGRIEKLSYQGEKGRVEVTSPEQLEQAIRTNRGFNHAMVKASNPRFLSFHDGPAYKALSWIKTSYTKKLFGKNPKEFDEDIKKNVNIKNSLASANLKAVTDEDGKPTGEYTDEAGNRITQAEYDKIKQTEARIKSSPSAGKLAGSIARGVKITGVADTACTVYSTARAVEAGVKILRRTELARFATAMLLEPASELKAEGLSPEKVEYYGNKYTHVDMRSKVVDEAKLASTSPGGNMPMIDNPNKGKSGMDAAFYKLSALQEKPRLTLSNQRFLASGALNGRLGSVLTSIKQATGARTHQELKQTCKMLQNPAVQGSALVLGIAAGVATVGVSTVAVMGGSMLIDMALPLLTAQLADMIAGQVTSPDLKGTDLMDAVAIGSSVLMNEQAKARGMMPLPPSEMVEYQNTNRKVELAYQDYERAEAAKTPFAMYNPHSFAGSLAQTLLPHWLGMRSSGAHTLAHLAGLLPTAAGRLSPLPAQAVSLQIKPERYQHSNGDSFYQEMGVAVDPSGELVYGLPKPAMDLSPEDATYWMIARDEIDPSDESGAPKDNGQAWNYKKYVEQCIGEHEDTPECMDKAHYEQNWHYAKFHMVNEWAKVQDGDAPGLKGGSESTHGTGQTGQVNSDGWAYPTTPEAIITSGFGMRGGQPHNGADFAQPGGAEGKPIFATRDGKVIAAGPASGFGNWIVIQHEVDGQRYDSVYGHMYNDGVLVKQGDEVKAGQEIGAIGNAGQSTGPHLHFEIWRGGHRQMAGGTAIDPKPLVGRTEGAQPATHNQGGGDVQ